MISSVVPDSPGVLGEEPFDNTVYLEEAAVVLVADT